MLSIDMGDWTMNKHENDDNRQDHSNHLSHVQRQFGSSAEAYATSQVHAKGASLKLLLDAIEIKTSWRVLDVATGAGHTALAIAPFVEQVVAADLTHEMLLVAKRLGAEAGTANMDMVLAEAGQLSFASASFDLVTCRIAAHHFPDLPAFVSNSARILNAGGILAVVDNIVPGGYRNRKEARRFNETGRYINAFDKLRDPSHVWCLTRDQWLEHFYQNDIRVIHQETNQKELELNAWASRMNVAAVDLTRLRVMLQQAPSQVREYFRPRFIGDEVFFSLTELILIGVK
jgi:ubiquinone/menaquinone biosynthesis C-methylase UbiE